jgi:hypothetical protein
VLIAVAGLLVWHPWTPGSTVPTPATGSGVAGEGPLRSPLPDGPPDPSARRAALTLPMVTGTPRALPTPPPGFAFSFPAELAPRPRWSVIGAAELPEGGLQVTQVPLVSIEVLLDELGVSAICHVGRLRSAHVGILPARWLRFLGIVGPADGIVGWTQLDRIGGPPLAAYELPVPDSAVATPAPGSPPISVRLFVRADAAPWEAGAYRFFSRSGDGSPRLLYACLVDATVTGGL